MFGSLPLRDTRDSFITIIQWFFAFYPLSLLVKDLPTSPLWQWCCQWHRSSWLPPSTWLCQSPLRDTLLSVIPGTRYLPISITTSWSLDKKTITSILTRNLFHLGSSWLEIQTVHHSNHFFLNPLQCSKILRIKSRIVKFNRKNCWWRNRSITWCWKWHYANRWGEWILYNRANSFESSSFVCEYLSHLHQYNCKWEVAFRILHNEYIFFFLGLVPFILLLSLNVAIYRQICEMQDQRMLSQQQEIRFSQISIAIAAGINLMSVLELNFQLLSFQSIFIQISLAKSISIYWPFT